MSSRYVALFAVCSLLALCLVPSSGVAKELPPGTTITPDNLSEHLDDTVEGHTLESLLPKGMMRRIKRDGQVIRLGDFEPLTVSPTYRKATDKYASKVQFNPESRTLSNYVAGTPFPSIDPEDPNAGYKVMYNSMYGKTSAHWTNWLQFYVVFVDGEQGVERERVNTGQVMRMVNWWEAHDETARPGDYTAGDGSLFVKELTFVLSPQNVRGIGGFSIEYTDNKTPSSWVYVRSLRRTRRTTGSSWFTRISGLGDYFSDGIAGGSSNPALYPDIEYLGTRTILTARAAKKPPVAETGQGDRYVFMADERSPYWTLDPEAIQFVPRKVHVIKQSLPDAHQLGSRTVYVNARTWRQVFTEEYDKSGNLWQSNLVVYQNLTDPNGHDVVNVFAQNLINWKAHHATNLTVKNTKVNQEGHSAEEFGLNVLRTGEPYNP